MAAVYRKIRSNTAHYGDAHLEPCRGLDGRVTFLSRNRPACPVHAALTA